MDTASESTRVRSAPQSAAELPVVTERALVTRQPIYGPAMTVMGYELLYSPAEAAARLPAQRRAATLRVLADAVLEVGLDRLAAGLPVHLQYPRELLVESSPLSLQPSRVVIETVADRPQDRELIAGLRRLRTRGHHIALDARGLGVNDPELLEVLDIVKLDVSRETPQQLDRLVPELVRQGLRLIARGVQTLDQFEHCAALGFEGFEGDFLHRPETFRAQRVPSSRVTTLQLLAALQDEDYAVDEVEELISRDIALAYRVLRCINSSYYGLPRKVESIRQGIVILGLDNLRQLCTLVALHGFDDRPSTLFVTAMTRARMCEQLARMAGVRDTGPYFITGLFSLLDVLTGMALPQLLDQLPLAPAVERALIAHEGDLGAALRCTRAYERASWTHVRYGTLDPQLIRAAYVDAVFWSEQTQAIISH